MGIRDMAESRGPGSLFLDPDLIQELPGYNVRDMDSEATQAHIEKMVLAITENGTQGFPPITVKLIGDEIFVVAGYCRRRAHSIAKANGAPVKGILAIPEQRKDEASLVLDLLTSNDGLPLTPYEQAQAVKRLLDFQWTAAEIARRRGVSPKAITNLIALLEAPREVQEMVKNGDVSATLATKVVREEGGAAATETLAAAVKTAKESGKAKATEKHTAPKKPAVAWNVIGPKLHSILEAMRDAKTTDEFQAAFKEAGVILDGLK